MRYSQMEMVLELLPEMEASYEKKSTNFETSKIFESVTG
jgi:hypothetical protein